MNHTERSWENLGLSNDFLFGKVMRKPELCKEMLELILEVEIERLEFPEAQKSIDEEKDAKGVRLDVYVKNGNGEAYWELKRSYVIFICTFDLFGKGLHRYTFENVCLEDKKIRLNDGTAKIFLNTEGTAEDVGRDLKAFLDYVGGREPESGFVKDRKSVV